MSKRSLIAAIAGAPNTGPDFAQGLIIEKIIHGMVGSNGRPVRI